MKLSVLSVSFFASAIFILFYSSSCKKNEGCGKSGLPGLGGTASIAGYVRHHNNPIPLARVFLKFGAKEFPGSDTTIYNLSVTADSGDAHYKFEGINSGDYYLYGIGYDSTIPKTVLGGVPAEICDGTQSVEINVPVTED